MESQVPGAQRRCGPMSPGTGAGGGAGTGAALGRCPWSSSLGDQPPWAVAVDPVLGDRPPEPGRVAPPGGRRPEWRLLAALDRPGLAPSWARTGSFSMPWTVLLSVVRRRREVNAAELGSGPPSLCPQPGAEPAIRDPSATRAPLGAWEGLSMSSEFPPNHKGDGCQSHGLLPGCQGTVPFQTCRSAEGLWDSSCGSDPTAAPYRCRRSRG